MRATNHAAVSASSTSHEQLLAQVQGQLDRGEVARGMADLFSGLLEARRITAPTDWRQFAQETAIQHPLRDVIHSDPMCRRSFDKPRGYAGDAVLLDYIYGIRKPEAEASLGRSIYDYNAGRPAARGVRLRREWIAHAIDRCVDDFAIERGHKPRVLSIACGHLREAELSAAVRNGWLEELVALDADAESLKVAAGNADCVTTVAMSIGRLMARPEQLGEFDFVYSAGLFDYLEPKIAKRLIRCMFDLLRPGGRLMFSNFLPSVPDAGYMETYMGWELIYRTVEDLEELLTIVPDAERAAHRVYEDPYASIGYAELRRT